eukprot:TRINITY_DN25917_c0_g1_i2.p1 TRINITY_DN25917_c0_g1~~TRINITY_DN25917_c0_g1_i2.p1  ORF type:complete len:709 (+),score=135.43 TRINITY_DN25917_c0_g1_i2:180-2129(+)
MAAAGALAVEPFTGASNILQAVKLNQNGPLRSASSCSQGPRQRRRESLRGAPWPPPEASPKLAARVALPLHLDATSECWQLRFGDAVRLLLPPRGEGVPAALCTCTQPPVSSDRVGAHEAVASEAADEERRLARELAASGRRAASFVAVTAAPSDPEGPISRRSVWEVYRANPLDDFPAAIVHYGQHVHLGQRSIAAAESSEILLSCEPPSREAGIGASYLALGRCTDYGYQDPVEEPRKNWNRTFVFAPVHKESGREGGPVDLRYGVKIVPLSSFSYLHGIRLLHAVPGELPNGIGRGCSCRTVNVGNVRELVLTAALPNKSFTDTWWLIDRLALSESSVEQYDRKRKEGYTGVARALLGRALGPPQAPVKKISGLSGPSSESSFARWDHFRNAVLLHLRQLGDVFACSTFRKVLAKDCLVPETRISTDLFPHAGSATPADERILVSSTQVAGNLKLNFGISVSDEDMVLMTEKFGVTLEQRQEDVPGKRQLAPKTLQSSQQQAFCAEQNEQYLDIDLLCDALRGEISPGRQILLQRLYAVLQAKLGLEATQSLSVKQAQLILDKQLDENRLLPPVDVMNALPLLRGHAQITRAAFVRWNLDLSAFAGTNAAFLAFMAEIWGTDLVTSIRSSIEEKSNWKLPLPAGYL